MYIMLWLSMFKLIILLQTVLLKYKHNFSSVFAVDFEIQLSAYINTYFILKNLKLCA
jgi:hypothetical protein